MWKCLTLNVRIVCFIVVCILFVYNCVQYENIKVKDITLYDLERPALVFPTDLYITNQFSEKDKISIRAGVDNWVKATNNRVAFNVIFDYTPERPFTRDNYEFFSKYTVWKFNHTDPLILPLQLRHGFFDGASIGNFIVISESEQTKDKLYVVFSHELGHLIGCEHLKQEYKGLMNIGGNRGVITRYDLVQFDAIYKKD